MENEILELRQNDENQSKNIARNSAFEILKIICIIAIIAHHYVIHGALNVRTNAFTFNEIFLDIVGNGFPHVTIMMMISGFFLINSTKVKWKKFFELLFEALFFSLAWFIVQSIATKDFSFSLFYESVFSIFLESTWYVGCYLIVYALHPFINKALKACSDKELNALMLFLFVAFVLIPTLPYVNFFLNRLVVFLTLYCFGAYLSIHKESKYFTKGKGFSLFAVSFVLLIVSMILIRFLSRYFDALGDQITYFATNTSILYIGMASGLIVFCASIKPFVCKPINFIASFSLGIYLFHDNTIWQRDLFYRILFKVPEYAKGYLLVLNFLLTVALIFLCGLTISIVYRFALEKPIEHLLKLLANKRGASSGGN